MTDDTICNDEVFFLHEKSKLTPLLPWEREVYEEARGEVQRGMMAAQELMRRPDQSLRRSLRIRHEVPLTVRYSGHEIAARTVNISSGGCAVVLPSAPDTDIVEFELRFACGLGLKGSALVVAVVHHPHAVVVCLRFLDQNELDTALVDDVIIDIVLDHLVEDRERRVLELLGNGDAFGAKLMKKVS
ncbi:MAG: PilZ domain-containing protein [Deltaproteobacteria bacterium]|nr:PilZ domain-containing protein [Deltaproteobacteria bacterium]